MCQFPSPVDYERVFAPRRALHLPPASVEDRSTCAREGVGRRALGVEPLRRGVEEGLRSLDPTARTGRRGPLKHDATLVDKMDRKESTKKGRALYKHRQQFIEPIFGQIKEVRGIRQIMRRGRAAADSEWKLICGTHNLLKLYRRAVTKPGTVPFSRLAVPVAG